MTRSPVVLAVAVAALLTGLSSLPAAASANEIPVTSFEDNNLDDGQCTLREALTETSGATGNGDCAPAGGSFDTIRLPAGTYLTSRFEMAVQPVRRLTIAGAGAAITTITPGDYFRTTRRFGIAASAQVTVQDLTIANAESSAVGGDGGAIKNDGHLTILRCVFKDNHTGRGVDGQDAAGAPSNGAGNPGAGFSAGRSGDGGAIWNSGSLTVRDSTFSGNYTGDGGDGGDGTGGDGHFGTGAGGFNGGSGTGGAAGEAGAGGAIFSTGDLTIERTLFTTNHTGHGGAGGDGTGGSGGTGGAFSFTGGQGGSGTAAHGRDGGAGGAVAVVGAADGMLAIADSTFVENHTGDGGMGGVATGGQGGQGGGGGIGMGGTGGTGGNASGGAGGTGGKGGALAILLAPPEEITVSSSVFEGNAAGSGGDGSPSTGGPGGPGGAAAFPGAAGSAGYGDNSAGGYGGDGGAISSNGAPVLTNVTFTRNAAGSGGDGADAPSPGTPGASTAGGWSGRGGNGGAVEADSPDANHITVSSNSVGAAGSPGSGPIPGTQLGIGIGGGLMGGFRWQLRNSIVASNNGGNCTGISPPDGAHNVVFPQSDCSGTNADPHLAGLADNGGPTRTQALGPGSAARELVPAAGADCAPVDQRGVNRPQVAACDAGAYEASPPSATTGPASSVTETGALLAGSINPNLRSTTYRFEFGPTSGYGKSTSPADAGAGESPVGVATDLSGLKPSTTYHYRLVASNSDGTSNGADSTFTTHRDSTVPRIRSASLKPSRFRAKKGAKLRYVLSEAARVSATVARVRRGHRAKRSARFAMKGRAGANTRRFRGVFKRRPLKSGRYRLTLVASDAAGHRSPPKRLSFTIVPSRPYATGHSCTGSLPCMWSR